MPKANGTVQAIDVKKTQAGKTYYRVNVDGAWYSTWEKPNFSQGQEIEFDVIQKGDFKNLANAVVLESNSGRSEGNKPVATSRPNGSFDPDREARIIRQNAFSTAAAIVGNSKLAGKADVEVILATTLEVAKKVFEVNMYGYNAGKTATSAKQEDQPPATSRTIASPSYWVESNFFDDK